MSIPSISPVIGRIQSIESRFSVPSGARVSTTARGSNDFAATLSAAFANSSAAPAGSTASLTTALPGALGPTGLYATPLTTAGNVSGGFTAAVSPGGTPYDALFAEAGARHGVSPALLSAVGFVESSYRPDAVSSAGAIGLMQIMPFTADELGVDPTDPAQAVDGAARLLRSHYDRFGSWDLALAAYNAGAGAVKRAGNTIPSPGVAEYVRRVNERMAQ